MILVNSKRETIQKYCHGCTKKSSNLVYCGGGCHFYCFVTPVQDVANLSYVAIKDINDTDNGHAEYLYAKLSCFQRDRSNMFCLPIDDIVNPTTP